MMDFHKLLIEMRNTFYEAEDELEKQYVGTDESDDWFGTYRPWMQRGFDIAMDVIAKERERIEEQRSQIKPLPPWIIEQMYKSSNF